eukprot:TRINITY_DN1544_c0_g1_i1.p1 TRINITY_DN1544_c0_g1~~TRINITY_DN1544_c0_g1_i1.p1  ORF type:complete len:367 (+),score=30.15 TRINITY_DN1544_c0_g1_i1:114-1214(+)
MSVEAFRNYCNRRIKEETSLLLWIQSFRTPCLDIYFQQVTILGNEIAYLLLLPLMTWGLPSDSSIVEQMLLLCTLNFLLGHGLKDYLKLPRPTSPIVRLTTNVDEEYGLPSTHAIGVITLPTYLLLKLYEENDTSLGFISWCLLILFLQINVIVSRLYLGVHSLLDILAGIIISLFNLCVMLSVSNQLSILVKVNVGMPFLFFPLLFALLLYMYPKGELTTSVMDTTAIMGATLGVIWGSFIRSNYRIPVTTNFDIRYILARSITGLILVLLIHVSTKKIFYRLLDLLLSPFFPPRTAISKSWTTRNGVIKENGKHSAASSSALGKKREQEKSLFVLIFSKFVVYIGIGLNTLVLAPFVFNMLGIL